MSMSMTMTWFLGFSKSIMKFKTLCGIYFSNINNNLTITYK